MTPGEIFAALVALADRAGRLRPPDRHRPEVFHEDRSELEADLLALARKVAPDKVPAKVRVLSGRKPGVEFIEVAGRSVLVQTKRPGFAL